MYPFYEIVKSEISRFRKRDWSICLLSALVKVMLRLSWRSYTEWKGIKTWQRYIIRVTGWVVTDEQVSLTWCSVCLGKYVQKNHKNIMFSKYVNMSSVTEWLWQHSADSNQLNGHHPNHHPLSFRTTHFLIFSLWGQLFICHFLLSISITSVFHYLVLGHPLFLFFLLSIMWLF